MEDNEIVRALEDLAKCNNNEIDCDSCSLSVFYPLCPEKIGELALDLINRQEEKIERLKKSNRNWRRKVQSLKADNNELIYKLECLLCHSTGGKLSKHTYPLGTMESYVNDAIQEYCEEAEKEAKSEARKEFAERLKEQCNCVGASLLANKIDNLLKEMESEENA